MGIDTTGSATRDDDTTTRSAGQTAASSAQDQQEAGYQSETITFDNKDIEVTHNAADGNMATAPIPCLG